MGINVASTDSQEEDGGADVAYFVRLLLVVEEMVLHVQHRLVVVHVLGQIGVSGVLLQEGVGCCHCLLQVVQLQERERGL